MTRRKKAILITAGALFLLGILGLISYYYYMAITIHARLSHRRWQVPAVVYSNSELLYPGERLSRDSLIRMLLSRGYRFVSHTPRLPGRFTSSKSRLYVYLRDFTYPDHRFKGFLLTVSFRNRAIASLRRGKNPIDLVSLEPMEIARLFGKEREARELISFHEAPRPLIDAIILMEDRRFFHHHGIDWHGIFRALLVDLRHGKIVQGGSTITQQLAKNYFLHPERSLSRKLKEALIALILESRYSKKEILEMYMNEIYMGQQEGTSINGMGEAAKYYSGHGVRDLTLGEAALLAGMIRAPNLYSPFLHPDRAKKRRNLVLKRLRQAGKITKTAFDTAIREPVTLPATPGISMDTRYYVDFLNRQLKKLYPADVLAGQGLRIFTSLQPEFQEAAVQAVRSGLKRLERTYPVLRRSKAPLQAAMIVIRPRTGEILAMVGGRNYAKSPFNRAVDAHRQPGSLFKPIVYLTALDAVTPATVIEDGPVAYKVHGKPWVPKNYDGRYHGRVTVRTALEHSLNAATVSLALRVGLKEIVTTARRLGITSRLAPTPSLALGAFEVTPLEIARVYCAFANGGQLPFLLTLRNVVSEKGTVEQRRPVEVKTVCSPAKAFLITSLLQGVVRHGTAQRLRRLGIRFPCAGKTGTTSGYRDAWFVGYTPDLLAIVWVGFDDNRNTHLTGASGALPIWADFMKRIGGRLTPGLFITPPGVVKRWITVDVDWPRETLQPRTYEEVFLAETAPERQDRPGQRRSRSGRSIIREIFKGVLKGLQDVFR